MFEITDVLGDFQWRIKNQTVGAVGWSQIVPADPRRVLIIINGPGSDTLLINPVQAQNLSPSMFAIGAGQTVELFWARHGAFVTFEFWGMLEAASGPVAICVSELFWMPSEALA